MSSMSPFVMVIFGATGDLAHHKLIPSLFSLFKDGLLPSEFYIFGFARRDISDEDLRSYYGLEDDTLWGDFSRHLFYQQGEFQDDAGYLSLIKRLEKIDEEMKSCVTRLFYLATPPDNYNIILEKLSSTKLSEGCGQGSSKWTRVAIEKPFGKDLETAQMLDSKLAEIFDEKQIFRVDHYLGKENVQNMLAFRFANGIFEPTWNNSYIDHIQVTISEKNGIGKRGKFFDGVGNLRDVAQNHLLQLVAAVTMEQPRSFTKEDVRDARAQAIQSIESVSEENMADQVVRGQYQSYKSEKNVADDSKTETFVAMKFFMSNERMKFIPIYARAGKKMEKDIVEISIVFKQTCHILFKEYGCPEIGNVITIRIQPDEGIQMRFITKKPGTRLSLEPVQMKFAYKDHFEKKGADAYEKVLMDILAGEQMLFNRTDELLSSWKFITHILNGWEKADLPVYVYEDASMGPQAAHELIEKDGRKWL
ncbi:MAG: glucose-6-phosphate 1-dehydrogenase [Patescibacteria group bacterium]|nr:glucose-6-phosphate 1-dehydrogenase [Patescibacteria group bacterium]